MRFGNLRLILVAMLVVVAGSSAAAAGLTGNTRTASTSRGSIVVASFTDHGIYRRYPNGDVKQLVKSGHDVFPLWSPNGKRIAFEVQTSLNGGCPLMVMASDGSHVHRVGRTMTDCSGAGWAPNGRRLAFGGWPGLGPCTPPSPPKRCPASRESLWIVNVDGSGGRRLLSDHAENLRGAHPTWSPDGGTIVFAWSTPAPGTGGVTPGLFSIHPDGSSLHAFLTQQAKGIPTQPTWSHDGSRLAFGDLDLAPPLPGLRIIVATADGSDQRILSRLSTDGPQGAQSWSPNDRTLAISGFCGRTGCVWTIPSGGGKRHQLMRGPFMDANWGPAGT